MRILKRLLVGLLILVAAALAAMYIADPLITTRLVGLPFGGGTGPEERVAGGAPAELPVAQPAARSIAEVTLRQAIAYGEQTSSHALLIWHNNALQLEHYYPGFDRTTLTPTQSMHKSVLALLVGIAIRDGLISSVDDPASRYLPEWAGDGRAAITIRQMLQQQSGIGFPRLNYWNPAGDFFQVMMGGDLAAVALRQPLEGEPGGQFDYNNINPQVLGILLERVAGKRYSQYLSEALWTRIGADDAYVVLDSEEKRVPRIFCCLNATARSWLQVGMLHLTGGTYRGEQVVPQSWIRDVETPSPRNPNYGYFTWLGTEYQEHRLYNHKSGTTAYHSEPFAASDVIYFDGFGGQRVYVVPSLGLIIVRTGAMSLDWDDAYLPNLVIRSLQATPSP